MHLTVQDRCENVISHRHEPSSFARLRTIADVGGFARAAMRLHLSQPALSRQIHALEADLGVPLFDRVGRRAILTSQATIFCGAAAD